MAEKVAEKFRFAVAPFPPRSDPADNLETAAECLARAAGLGADVICFSELFLGLTPLEPLPNAPVHALCESAAAYRINVVTGTIRAPSEVARKARLWTLAIDREGRIAGQQAKRRLYRGERPWFLPGEELQLFELDFGRVAVLSGLDAFDPTAAAWAAEIQPDLLVLQTGAHDDASLQLQRAVCRLRCFETGAVTVTTGRLGELMDFRFHGGAAAFTPDPEGQGGPPQPLFTLGEEAGVQGVGEGVRRSSAPGGGAPEPALSASVGERI